MDRRKFLSAGALALATITIGGDTAVVGIRPRARFSLVPARMADELCQSYCINTKTFYARTVYGNTDAVTALVEELGARIVRERVLVGGTSASRIQQQAMLELANAGVRWHGTVGTLDEWPSADEANRQVIDVLANEYAPQLGGNLGQLMHSFGGCNEIDGPVVDGRVDPEWAAHARLMQQSLWAEAKSNRMTRDVPVAGPSTRSDVTVARAEELGDLSAWCDRFGNAHMYNRGASPTQGIDTHLSILDRCFPDADRWIFSETGYNNSPQDTLGLTVPEDACATYAVRGICDFFKRDAIYGRFELLDDPDVIDKASQVSINQTAEREAHFGLVAMTQDTIQAATPDTWRKKPEFYATQRLLSLLADRGNAFGPAGLVMRVTGGGDDLQQLLLQKRDGRHYVILWRDVDVSTTYPDARSLPVQPDSITVEFKGPRPVAVYEPGTSSRPIASRSDTNSVTLPLAGELVAVQIG